MYGCIYLKFELNESIIKQLIKQLFHKFYCYIALIQNVLSNKL